MIYSDSLVLIIFFTLASSCKSFTPSRDLQALVELIDSQVVRLNEEDTVTETLTHIDILKQGLVGSLVKYFSENQSKLRQHRTRKVSLSRLDSYLVDIDELFRDYYDDQSFSSFLKCNSEFNKAFEALSDSISNVDFDPVLKDLPHAHFDSETLTGLVFF